MARKVFQRMRGFMLYSTFVTQQRISLYLSTLKVGEGALKPTQLIFTTLEKARSKIPKDHYSRENGSREYYIKKD